jgi:hypothetical protein
MNKIKSHNFFSLSWLLYFIFFAGVFIYFSSFADYIFFYQEKSSLFIFSHDFLSENLHQPGGLLIYAGKFFTTFFYYPFAGALIAASVLTLIVFQTSKIIILLNDSKAQTTFAKATSVKGCNGAMVLSLIPGIALFYLQTDYRFLLFNSLGILIQLAFLYLVIRYYKQLGGWLPVVISPLWYFLTGSFSWVFFLFLTFYYAFVIERKGWSKIIVLWILNALTFYISKEFLFFQPGKTLLIFPFTELNTGYQSVIFLSVVVFTAILPLITRIKLPSPANLKISSLAVNLMTISLLLIILATIGYQKFDNKTKQYFHVEKLFYHNKFNEVIAYNKEYHPTNILTIFLNNIALCEEDKLDDMLFDFPQSPDGKTLFLKWEIAGEILRRGGYFYYTIGMINEAHRWAFENMVMTGFTPEGLKMLIKTDLINGNYKVAAMYAGILKKTLFYRKEAKAFEKLLFNDGAINTDKDLGEKRKIRLKSDFFSITDDPAVNIDLILGKDSLNKKAFEYKVAYLLLRKDYQGIAKELPKFENLGFTKLPVNVEEAVIAISIANKGRLPDMGSIRISQGTITRWQQYLSVLQQYGNDVRSAEPALRRRFGNTFWYWVFYR